MYYTQVYLEEMINVSFNIIKDDFAEDTNFIKNNVVLFSL